MRGIIPDFYLKKATNRQQKIGMSLLRFLISFPLIKDKYAIRARSRVIGDASPNDPGSVSNHRSYHFDYCVPITNN